MNTVSYPQSKSTRALKHSQREKETSSDETMRYLQAQLDDIQKMLLVNANASEESGECIYIRSKGKRQRVCFADIIWIESERNYVSFHTKNETFSTLIPISSIERQLPEDKFVRVHKSFIVALQRVNYTLKSEIGVEWDSTIKQIPLGAQYRKNFLTVIEQSTARRSKNHKLARSES